MTQQEQQISAAELDGWTDVHVSNGFVYGTPQNWSGVRYQKVYYTDYNTIIPLIQKWCNATPRGWIMFLCELTRRTTPFDEIQTLDKAQGFYNATPYQLRKALLKAAGKWKEDVK